MRIAVIGAGSIGRRHLASLLALGERQIGIYDADLSAAAALCTAEIGEAVGCFADIDDVWEWQPTCVLICTPPSSHMSLAAEAYRHGVRGIFIEKPLALAPVPVDVGMWADCVTMVVCNWRFADGPRQIKRWLADGVLGEAYTARMHFGYSIDDRKGYKGSYVAKTGAVLDIGAHALDLMLDWFGSGQLSSAVVRPATSIGLPKMDGAAEILVAHDSGVMSSIHVNLLQRHYRHAVEITGREGTIGYCFREERIYSRLWAKPYEDCCWRDEPDMFVQEIAHFLACVRDNRPTCNPVAAAAKTLNLLLEAKTWAKRSP